MKALVIGAAGTVGQYVVKELERDTQIISAGINRGDVKVDLGDAESIHKMYQAVDSLDAVICVASRGVVFKPLGDMTAAD